MARLNGLANRGRPFNRNMAMTVAKHPIRMQSSKTIGIQAGILANGLPLIQKG